jgi:hypothetical protein
VLYLQASDAAGSSAESAQVLPEPGELTRRRMKGLCAQALRRKRQFEPLANTRDGFLGQGDGEHVKVGPGEAVQLAADREDQDGAGVHVPPTPPEATHVLTENDKGEGATWGRAFLLDASLELGMRELARPPALLDDSPDATGTMSGRQGSKIQIPGADGFAHLLDVRELGTEQLARYLTNRVRHS